jgi:hypothetical protein
MFAYFNNLYKNWSTIVDTIPHKQGEYTAKQDINELFTFASCIVKTKEYELSDTEPSTYEDRARIAITIPQGTKFLVETSGLVRTHRLVVDDVKYCYRSVPFGATIECTAYDRVLGLYGHPLTLKKGLTVNSDRDVELYVAGKHKDIYESIYGSKKYRFT